MTPNDSSDTWGPLPPWLAASTGPHDLIPEGWKSKANPRPATTGTVKRPSRPDTLRLVAVDGDQLGDLVAATGLTKRGSPPPDMMRVLTSVALLGFLLMALGFARMMGG